MLICCNIIQIIQNVIVPQNHKLHLLIEQFISQQLPILYFNIIFGIFNGKPP